MIEGWNPVELMQRYQVKYVNNLTDRFREYVGTLLWKDWKSYYHKTASDNLWEELSKKGKVSFKAPETWDVWISSVAEIEAMIQSLHSIGDILAQIINVAILQPHTIAEASVNVTSVLKEMQKRHLTSAPAFIKLNTLKNSNEFKYLEGFCNVMKHRRVIDTEHKLQASQQSTPGQLTITGKGIQFKSFEYKGTVYPETFSKTIEEDYRGKISSIVNEIMISVHDYLK